MTESDITHSRKVAEKALEIAGRIDQPLDMALIGRGALFHDLGKDYTLHRLEERIIIYADRLVDIITEDIVPIGSEKEAEEQFEQILSTIVKYGKNDITFRRYLSYHREIQGLSGAASLT